ncbi:phenylalanine--tRNA ligase beta subunit [Rhizocola hellebori]|uniref:Phenylalanine--tRNA ligase beta subunit n=1 Tax=Rhizocola hellebori TaxID=1392758 RepID=A0A8J3VM09_9ACTN|nr:phenylalanine--tRNA ligase subunit beta [Rhizocola hellebori]GIH10706.1 phenylalanine--tRNA ligase beta subunit [Rhizocola hellebori]
MRVGLSWLREHVQLPAKVSAAEIDLALTNLGIEVEHIVDQRELVTGDLVVGRVLTIEELTEFKKPIRFVTLDIGQSKPQEVICGATNFAEGDLVVVILPGGVLPGGFEVGSRKTYGRVSNGMICSARELGISDDHAGIIVLDPAVDAKLGDDARHVLGMDDIGLAVEITPDRGYQMSVRGLARELAHAYHVPFTDPGLGKHTEATKKPAWPLTIDDPAGCDRYAARLVRGVDPKAPTPDFMKRRLTTAGIRTLGLPIDITNYVMLELGQPMHAFDADRINGALVVRRAKAGEKLVTLDGSTRVLSEEDMVICDDTGPISLAAVMGGQTSEVVDGTTNVLFEAAHWDPTMVGRTARRHKLFSEAAKRWERGVDRNLCLVGIERAVSLLVEYGGGKAGKEVLDLNYPSEPVTITMAADKPSKLIGVDYSVDRISDLLTEIGCDVAAYDDRVEVVPPSWRPDLREPADLVEEVVRLDGFENVPSVLPIAPPGNGLTAAQRRKRGVGRALAEQGYVEVLSYPFVSRSVMQTLGVPEHAVRLANPISEEEPFMRTSLLPGLLGALKRNLGRGQRDVALFEQGLVFLPAPQAALPPTMGVAARPEESLWQQANAAVPRQPWQVAAVLAGEFERSGWWGAGRVAGWADAVQAARDVLAASAVPERDIVVEQLVSKPFHPGRCAGITIGGVSVGMAGELHPEICAALEVPRGTCAMELQLDAVPLPGVTPPPVISNYPPALIDVALVLPQEIPNAAVEAALLEGAGPLLESLRLFDVYQGKGIEEGKRSLAYNLTFRAPDRTLKVEEAVAARDSAVAVAASRFGAVLRGTSAPAGSSKSA